MGRLGAAAGATLGGVCVGVLALVTHRLGGTALPWGLALAAAVSVSVSAALGVLGAGRAALVGYGLGWGAAVVVALGGRPEGDYLVAGDPLGWGLLLGVFGAVVVATVVGVAVARPAGDPSVPPRRADARASPERSARS
ncbi:hypothetical protein BH20ACT6_BH20ACT6_01410 [soil metagenome]